MDKLNTYTPEQLEQFMYAIQEKLLLIKQKEEEDNKNKKKDPNEKITCKICNGKYTRTNKATHEKTAKHKRELEYTNTLRNLAKSKTLLGRAQMVH